MSSPEKAAEMQPSLSSGQFKSALDVPFGGTFGLQISESSNDGTNRWRSTETFQNSSELELFCSSLQDLLRTEKTELVASSEGYTSIQHCQQLERWDCGIACIIMILRWISELEYPFDSTLTAAEMSERGRLLDKIGATESVWTADLVLLIDELFKEHHHQHTYLFCSKTLEVDSSHGNLAYYRSAFDKDKIRVTEKLRGLRESGSATLCLSHLPLGAVVRLVSHPNCVAIVLVDHSILFSKSAKSKNREGIFAALCGSPEPRDTYVGHYVILCGISSNPHDLAIAATGLSSYKKDDNRYCLALLDPGRLHRPRLFVTPEHFERAWRAQGTDDDIVFIVKHPLGTY